MPVGLARRAARLDDRWDVRCAARTGGPPRLRWRRHRRRGAGWIDGALESGHAAATTVATATGAATPRRLGGAMLRRVPRPRHRRRPPPGATPAPRPCSAGTRRGCGTCRAAARRTRSLMRSRSRRVRSHSSNCPSEMRSSMIRVTIARMAGSSRAVQRAHRRLDAVGQHDQRRLAGLRLRAGVPEPALVDGRGGLGALGGREAPVRLGRALAGPREEVAHDRRPVVLRDERDERLRKPGLVGDVDAVGHVLLEDLGGDLGRERVVDVLATGLVLDERERVRELADVVVVGRDAGRPAGRRRSPRRRARRGCRPSASGGTCPASRRAGAAAAAGTDSPARAAGRRSGSRTPSPGRRTSRRQRPTTRPRTPPRRTTAPGSPGCPGSPISENTETTRALTMKTAIAAWTKTCSRSPLRTAMMPAMPPRKM